MTKRYGVYCLVAESMRRAGGEAFRFRPVDRVQVKGKQAVVDVYELLGGPGLEVARYEGMEEYTGAVETYRRGELEEARAAFRAFLERNPGETVARMYLERMEGMGARAPEGWSGVFAHSSK